MEHYLIVSFYIKLINAYLTNLIKCGLNNVDGNFGGFQNIIPTQCHENFVTKEIEIINSKVVFCFGSNVYKYLYQQYSNEKFP